MGERITGRAPEIVWKHTPDEKGKFPGAAFWSKKAASSEAF